MALYLPDHNGLFLHAPKTGGTFVVEVLRDTLGLRVEEVGFKHSHKDLVGPLRARNKPTTFTLVRHPVSWYESYWQMKQREMHDGTAWFYWEPTTLWHPNWPIDPSCGDDDFGQFIRNVTARPDYLHAMYGWYTGLGTRDRADIVGKQETLTADLITFLDAIGADYDRDVLVEAERINAAAVLGASPEFIAAGRPTAVWTDELRELVLSAEKRCLLDYGYDADGTIEGPDGVPAARSVPPPIAPFEPKPWVPTATASRRRPPSPPKPAPGPEPALSPVRRVARGVKRRLRTAGRP